MGQIMKKVLCSILAVLMITSAGPIGAIALELESVDDIIVDAPETGDYETQSTPKDVNETTVSERLELLREFVKNNSYGYKYFTTTGKNCATASEKHGCTKCKTTELIKTNWIKNELGLIPSSESLLPYPRWASPEEAAKYGKEGVLTTPAYSCVGFTMIAHWFLYAQKSSDNIAAKHIATIDLSKSDAKTQLDKYAKPGDMLVFRTSITTDTYSHAAIYIGYNSSGVTVLDSNFGGTSGATCKMQEHTIYYSTYKYVEISRATNYTEETIPVFGAEIIDPEGNVTDNIQLEKGDTFQLGIKIYPDDATNKAVTWSSRDTSVATVSSSGLVTAKGIGNTVIVAETKDGGYKITCDVEVTEKTCLVRLDEVGTYTDYYVPVGEIFVIPDKIPTRDGWVFKEWLLLDISEGEWTTTKPSGGDYETGYKYYIWGYEHDSDYTYLYGDDKNELIEHVKKNSGTFGSYNPSKMRYLYLIESSDKGSSFYPGKSGSNYNYFNADYIAEDGKTGTASIYKTEFYFESKVYKQEEVVEVAYHPGDSILVTHDIGLTASWELPSVESYKITFDPNGGYGGIEYMFVEGTQFTVPDTEDCIPYRENFLFLYWFDDEGTYEPGKTYTINEEKHLLAAWAPDWEPEITVGNITGKPGEVVSVPVDIMNNFYPAYARIEFDVICEGLTFFNFEHTGTPLHGLLGYLHIQIPDDAVAGRTYPVRLDLKGFIIDETYDITVTVKVTNGSITIEEPEKATYTVTYDANGGTGAPAAQTKTEGEALKLSTVKPVRDGYEFLGWATSSTATTAQYQPGDSYTKDANVTLYAVWKQKEVIPEDAPTIVIGEVSGKPGETVEVPVVLKNNPGFAGADLIIEYDKDVLELIEIKLALFPANNMASVISGKISGGDSKDIAEDGEMFTAVFKIKETAKEGETKIGLVFYECYNINDEDVNFNISKGKVTVCSYIPGDANGDGKVSSRDITRILQYLVDELGDKTIDIKAADFNGDGKVSSRDITAILKYLVE